MVYKNADIVERIINFLSDGNGANDIIFLHIDKDSQEDFSNLSSIQNVYYTKTRFSTKWGSPELVFAVVNGLKELSKIVDFNYVILLSESDFPVKQSDYIHKYLDDYNKDYILTTSLPRNLCHSLC